MVKKTTPMDLIQAARLQNQERGLVSVI